MACLGKVDLTNQYAACSINDFMTSSLLTTSIESRVIHSLHPLCNRKSLSWSVPKLDDTNKMFDLWWMMSYRRNLQDLS